MRGQGLCPSHLAWIVRPGRGAEPSARCSMAGRSDRPARERQLLPADTKVRQRARMSPWHKTIALFARSLSRSRAQPAAAGRVRVSPAARQGAVGHVEGAISRRDERCARRLPISDRARRRSAPLSGPRWKPASAGRAAGDRSPWDRSPSPSDCTATSLAAATAGCGTEARMPRAAVPGSIGTLVPRVRRPAALALGAPAWVARACRRSSPPMPKPSQ